MIDNTKIINQANIEILSEKPKPILIKSNTLNTEELLNKFNVKMKRNIY